MSGMKNDLHCEHCRMTLHRGAWLDSRVVWFSDGCISRTFQGHSLNASISLTLDYISES